MSRFYLKRSCGVKKIEIEGMLKQLAGEVRALNRTGSGSNASSQRPALVQQYSLTCLIPNKYSLYVLERSLVSLPKINEIGSAPGGTPSGMVIATKPHARRNT